VPDFFNGLLVAVYPAPRHSTSRYRDALLIAQAYNFTGYLQSLVLLPIKLRCNARLAALG
jgi:hypothetical protein